MDLNKILGLFKNTPAQKLEVETATVDEIENNESEVTVTVRYGLTPHSVVAKKGSAITEVVNSLAKKLGLTVTEDTVITNVETGTAVTAEDTVEEPVEVTVQTTAGTNG